MILETEVSKCLHPISGSHRLHSCNAKKYMRNCRLEANQTRKIISNITVFPNAWKGLATGACCLNGFALVCSPQSQVCCIKEFPTCAATTIDVQTHFPIFSHQTFIGHNFHNGSQPCHTCQHRMTYDCALKWVGQEHHWHCKKKTLKAWTDSSNPKKQLASAKCS